LPVLRRVCILMCVSVGMYVRVLRHISSSPCIPVHTAVGESPRLCGSQRVSLSMFCSQTCLLLCAFSNFVDYRLPDPVYSLVSWASKQFNDRFVLHRILWIMLVLLQLCFRAVEWPAVRPQCATLIRISIGLQKNGKPQLVAFAFRLINFAMIDSNCLIFPKSFLPFFDAF